MGMLVILTRPTDAVVALLFALTCVIVIVIVHLLAVVAHVNQPYCRTALLLFGQFLFLYGCFGYTIRILAHHCIVFLVRWAWVLGRRSSEIELQESAQKEATRSVALPFTWTSCSWSCAAVRTSY